MTTRLRTLKAALGGDIYGSTLLCPTIGHPPKDRGTSLTDSPGAPDGLLAKVFNGSGRHDDLAAKDRALQILGETPDIVRRRTDRCDPVAEMRARAARLAAEESQRAEVLRRQRLARQVWDAAQDPRGTLAAHYLRSRALDLLDDIAGRALRFEPRGRWESGTAPMLIAAMRCVRSGELKAIHRTALTDDGQKLGRKMLGPTAGTAIMLTPPTDTLVIGEGVESSLSAIHLGYGPGVWAMGSAGAIGRLPVLDHIQRLVLLEERDTASANAVSDCGHRWSRAGKAVSTVLPTTGKDLNDSLRGIA